MKIKNLFYKPNSPIGEILKENDRYYTIDFPSKKLKLKFERCWRYMHDIESDALNMSRYHEEVFGYERNNNKIIKRTL